MEQYIVTGMSCAACQNRVEKAVSQVPGVTSCSVSLLTNSMGVEGTAKEADIIQAVKDAGYGASRKGAAREKKSSIAEEEEALKDRETPVLKRRLILSVAFLGILMYISMGHMMWGWPAPSVFDNHVFLGVFEMLLAIAVMVINGKFFTSGFKSLLFKITSASLPSLALRSSLSSSERGRELSRIKSTRSASENARRDLSIPMRSTVSSDSLIPAVSTRRTGMPLIWAFSSTVSLVVPGIFVTMLRSSPIKIFIREDFPTLGFPTIAVRIPSWIILPSSKVAASFLICEIHPSVFSVRIF